MSNPSAKPRPWLIAAWPGMSNVAVIAAGYLVQQLKMAQVAELPPDDFFDVAEVEVHEGVVHPPSLPHNVFFRWANPGGGRDLFVFIGEAQPTYRSLKYARELLAAAQSLGVERIVTFASLASGIHPSEHPKVTGIATSPALLEECARVEVSAGSDGKIGGLNGLILGAAAESGMDGMCLLAEIPYFAIQVPNPKAARAALSVFCVLAGVDVSLEALSRDAEKVDRALTEALEKLQAREAAEAEEGAEEKEGVEPEAKEPEEKPAPEPTGLDDAARKRIERLFDDARKDPSKAVALKQELDRFGVFPEYEGRFLDLFRRG
jgi:proteasome assembly chaperone (PAC2) family protein